MGLFGKKKDSKSSTPAPKSNKISIGDEVTDISGSKAVVKQVDEQRGRVAIKITVSNGPGTPVGKTMSVPMNQVRK